MDLFRRVRDSAIVQSRTSRHHKPALEHVVEPPVKESLPFIDGVESLPEPILLVSGDGLVLTGNPAASRTFGPLNNLRLRSLVDDSDGQLEQLMTLWKGSRTPLADRLRWRTPQGSLRALVTGWCARPPAEKTPALIVIRSEVEPTRQRLELLNRRLDELHQELASQRRVEAELINAINARDDFVAMAAHELRNPLNVLHLTLQLLHRMPDDQALTRKLLDRSREQLTRLSRLIDRLLDVTRIRAGKLEIYPETFELGDLMEEIVSRYRSQVTQITVQQLVKAEGAWDRLRVDQALSHVISNAVKYGMKRPIEVTLSAADGHAVIRVRDQGVGFSRGDAHRIFDRFERAREANKEGLGLGLWITRRIIEAHGGTIAADGQPGKGTVFTLRLPLHARKV